MEFRTQLSLMKFYREMQDICSKMRRDAPQTKTKMIFDRREKTGMSLVTVS